MNTRSHQQAPSYDAIIVGAGAAGLFCAGRAGQRGLRVALLDHQEQIAEKIRISGGGRCNFTNRTVGPEHFLSDNPHFCRSALARFTPGHFLRYLEKYRITWHEKHLGQLFCDDRAQGIIDMLLSECEQGQVQVMRSCSVTDVRQTIDGFELTTSRGTLLARSLVIATGGLSIPKIGATDWGYRLAQQFGHRLIPTRPALVPLTVTDPAWPSELSGLALPVRVYGQSRWGRFSFRDDLLFTHRGLSGPAMLQASSYLDAGSADAESHWGIDCLPHLVWPGDSAAGQSATGAEHDAMALDPKARLLQTLRQHWPKRLVDHVKASEHGIANPLLTWRDQLEQPWASIKKITRAHIAQALSHWQPGINGTEGYRKAEVTAGGVATDELDSKTMASRRLTGLYFIGEVVDVTGWLGGYNFQWAWASAAACADGLAS